MLYCTVSLETEMAWNFCMFQQVEKSPINAKSLLKRLYSYALHPGAFKRLGAALAFNNIYTVFRSVNETFTTFNNSKKLSFLNLKVNRFFDFVF